MFYGKDTPSIFLTERICQEFGILFDLIKSDHRFPVDTVIVILTFYACFRIKLIYRVQITFSTEWSHQFRCSTDHITVVHIVILQQSFIVISNKTSASSISRRTIRIISCSACIDIISCTDSIYTAVRNLCPVCLDQIDADIRLYIIIFRYDSIFITRKLDG